MLGITYAGSWFDQQSLKLAVAITDWTFADQVRHFGALPILVDRSLEELHNIRETIGREFGQHSRSKPVIAGLYINYSSNQVGVDVLADRMSEFHTSLEQLSINLSAVRIRNVDALPVLASEIRGGDCYENPIYSDMQVPPYWCSIGFSVMGGFITAGHCGDIEHEVESCSGVSMGSVEGSTWHTVPEGQRDYDSGWVNTFSTWQPVPFVNDYNDGQLTVSSEAGGYRVAPVGALLCRYGQASSAAHCGQIVARNVEVPMCAKQNQWGQCTLWEYLQETVRTDICVELGDSGGAFITATGQAQGTTIGGVVGTCGSNGPHESWFQPVGFTLETFDRTLLTAHGANPPVITSFNCPHAGISGGGMHYCEINYETQGGSIQWSTNTGDSGSEEWLFGTCTAGHTVSLSVVVSNPWGNDTRTATFPCPN